VLFIARIVSREIGCGTRHWMPISAIGAGMTEERPAPTILTARQHEAPSIFLPANLLPEARRQRGLPDENFPTVCALDPDGDIARGLQAAGAARHAGWACYHTDMYVTEHDGLPIGVVG
jgi:hypothetical protein